MATTSCDGPHRTRVRARRGSSPHVLAPCDLRRGAEGCQGRFAPGRCLPPHASPERTDRRNKERSRPSRYEARHHPSSTIPKLREESSFPDWITQHRCRSLQEPSPPARVPGVEGAGLRSWLRCPRSRSCRRPRSRRWPQPHDAKVWALCTPRAARGSLPDRGGPMLWWSGCTRLVRPCTCSCYRVSAQGTPSVASRSPRVPTRLARARSWHEGSTG